jgi:hypothetical protein
MFRVLMGTLTIQLATQRLVQTTIQDLFGAKLQLETIHLVLTAMVAHGALGIIKE